MGDNVAAQTIDSESKGAKMAKKGSGGFGALSKAAVSKTGSKSKSTVPTIVAPKDMESHIAAWIEEKRAETTHSAARKEEEGELIAALVPIHVQQCHKDSMLHSSLRVNGGDAGVVRMTRARKFLKMTRKEHEDDLLRIFGDKNYRKYFTIGTEVAISCGQLTMAQIDKLSDAIMKVLGNKAEEVVTVREPITPTDQYWNDRIFDTRIAACAVKAETEGLATPQRPSFGVTT